MSLQNIQRKCELQWNIIKHLPWTEDELPENVNICFNCVSSNFMIDEFNLLGCKSLSWFNKNVAQCCYKIIDARNTINVKNCIEECEDVVNVFEELGRKFVLENSGFEKLRKRLFHLGCVIILIWISKDVNMTIIKKLTAIVLKEVYIGNDFVVQKFLLKCISNSLELPNELVNFTALHLDVENLVYIKPWYCFNRRDYEGAISNALTSIQMESIGTNASLLSQLHNIIACSTKLLQRPVYATTHVRKALKCEIPDVCKIPYMFNVFQIYQSCNMTEESLKMINLIVANLLLNEYSLEKKTTHSVVLHFDKITQKTSLKIELLSNCTDKLTETMMYICANYCSKIGHYIESIKRYNQTIVYIKGNCSIKGGNGCCYKMPVKLPTMLQINAELMYTYTIDNQYQKVLQFENNELQYCINYFKNHQFGMEENRESDTDDINLDLAISSAKQLYHCVCVMTLKANALLQAKSIKEAFNIILDCIDSLESVTPCCDSVEDKCHLSNKEYQASLNYLSILKGKLFYNNALIMVCESKYDKKMVMQSIQSSLSFAPKSLELRWNVVMLLWKIGEKQESIKIWCKTRNINYRMDQAHIRNYLKQNIIKINDKNTTNEEKQLLEKDRSILLELSFLLSKAK